MLPEEFSNVRPSSDSSTRSAYWFLAAFVVVGLVAAYLLGALGLRGPGVLTPESADMVAALAIAVLAVTLVYLLVTYRASSRRVAEQASLLRALEARVGEAAAHSDAHTRTLGVHEERLVEGRERTAAVATDLETIRSAANQNARRLDEEHSERERAVKVMDRRQSLVADTVAEHARQLGNAASRLDAVEERTRLLQDDVAGNTDDVEIMRITFEEHAESERAVVNEILKDLGLLQDQIAAVDQRGRQAQHALDSMGRVKEQLETLSRVQQDQGEVLDDLQSAVVDIRQAEVERAALLEDGTSRTRGLEPKIEELAGRLDELMSQIPAKDDSIVDGLSSRLDQVIRRVEEMDQVIRRQSTDFQAVGALVERVGSVEGSLAELRGVEAETSRRFESLERRVEEREAALPVTIADLIATRKVGDGPSRGHGARPAKDIEGIGDVYSRRLRQVGVRSIDDLRMAQADAIAQGIGVRRALVEEWKDMAELMRVPGIGPQFSELLVKAGIRNIEALAEADAEHAYARIQETVEARDMPLNRAHVGTETVRRWSEAAATYLRSQGRVQGPQITIER